jgi:hydrogenase nickel incorporation protein HypA/HybF
MHEFSLIHDLIHKIQGVATEHGAQRVIAVKVSLGALSHISPDHFREHFDEAASGTVAEGAQLEIDACTDEESPTAQDILLQSVDVEV